MLYAIKLLRTGMSAPLLLLACALWGCAASGEDPSPRVEADQFKPISVIGGSGADPSDLVISRVVDAALSPSGRYAAVLDATPPYIQLADLTTGAYSSFGPKGQGPGELMTPGGVEFLDESQLIVLSPGRVDIFSPAGEWIRGVDLRGAGLTGMSIAVGCSKKLFVYGVSRAHSELDTVPWLHVVDAEGRADVEHWLPIGGQARSDIGFGALHGFDADSLGVWLWHVQRATGVERGYWVPCERLDRPMVRDSIWVYSKTPQKGRLNGQAGMALVLPDTLSAGAATDRGTSIRAVYWSEGGEDVTSFLLVERTGCKKLEVAGHWTVRDAEAGLWLLQTYGEYPSLLVLQSRTLVEQATAVKCVGQTQPRA